MHTRVITLARRPEGLPKQDDFQLSEEKIPTINTGELLLKSIYISVDPYLRGKMSGTKMPRFELHEPLSSKIIAEVIESKNEKFSKGEYVSHYLDWKEYQVSDGTGLVKVDAAAASLTSYLSVLGIPGLSAYFALTGIGKPKPGETLVVSGAAGAVGSIVGQIGKIMGCKVVGIVGTEEKAELIRSAFGFDDAINYNHIPDIKSAIANACPNGVNIYFDNVGGVISDGVIANMSSYGRIAACGAISNYNDAEEQMSPALLPLVVYKFLTIQGFLIGDYVTRFPEGLAQLSSWLQEEKLTYAETIIDGFENLPKAFIGLFEGKNQGKMLVRV